MQTFLHYKLTYFFVLLQIFVSFDILYADISTNSYCQLTVQKVTQQVSNFHQLITLAKQYKHNRKALAKKEDIKKVEFKKASDNLYLSFGITAKEYVTYMGKYGEKVNAFLESNKNIKQQLNELLSERDMLLEEYESTKNDN